MKQLKRQRGSALRAFTLIELVVVLGLILVLATLAIPAVSALRGTRSAEAGANLAAAMLSRARAEAVDRAAPVGVLFYLDPEEQRTTMVLVGTPSASLTDPDPFDQYMGWRLNVSYLEDDTSGPNVVTADTVIVLQRDGDPTLPTTDPGFGSGRPIVRKFACLQDHVSSLTNAPPQPPETANAFWGVIDTVPTGNLELLFDQEDGEATGNVTLGSEVLPNGVGLQVIVEPSVDGSGLPTSDRYVRTGIIMFDADGKLLSTTVDLNPNTSLGVLLGLDAGTPGDGSDDSPLVPLNTGFGIVAYNDSEFGDDDNRTDADWNGFLHEEDPEDDAFRVASAIPDVPEDFFDTLDYRDSTELAEEEWLDRNATPLMINRFTGVPFNTDGAGSVN